MNDSNCSTPTSTSSDISSDSQIETAATSVCEDPTGHPLIVTPSRSRPESPRPEVVNTSFHHTARGENTRILGPSTTAGAPHHNMTTRSNGEHRFDGNGAQQNSAMHLGDYYQGPIPDGASGHNYTGNTATNNSIVMAGNTHGETALQMLRLQLEMQRNRAAEANAAGQRARTGQSG